MCSAVEKWFETRIKYSESPFSVLCRTNWISLWFIHLVLNYDLIRLCDLEENPLLVGILKFIQGICDWVYLQVTKSYKIWKSQMHCFTRHIRKGLTNGKHLRVFVLSSLGFHCAVLPFPWVRQPQEVCACCISASVTDPIWVCSELPKMKLAFWFGCDSHVSVPYLSRTFSLLPY